MISIQNLVKAYGGRRVVDNVSVEIQDGLITGLVGPNGAGKSTIIRSLLGFVRADSGMISVDGRNIADDENYRAKIGYMPQRAALPDNLSAREILNMLADIRGQKSELLTDLFSLSAEMDKPVSTLSGGNLQKVLALIAASFNPQYYVLDEPTAGLDPVASSSFKDFLAARADDGKTILITSHILSDLEELADRIVFLLDGRIAYDGSVEEMLEDTGERNLERAVAQFMKGNSQWPASVKS